MPAEKPPFLKQQPEEPTAVSELKKITKRRRLTKKILPPIAPNRMKVALKEKEQEINRRLNSIYQDSDGQLPNMTRIKIKKTHPVIKFLCWLIVVGVVLAMIAWAGFIYLPANKAFSEDKVSLAISGPADIALGATSTYTIIAYNDQDADLNNAVLNLQYPRGFAFISSTPAARNSGHTEWDLNVINGRRKNTIQITGITYGAKGRQESWRAALTYQPDNFNYQVQKTAALAVEPKKMPLSLSIAGPNKTSINNQQVEYIYKLKKDNNISLGKLKIFPSFSPSFAIASSAPALADDNGWVVDTTTSTNTNLWAFKLTGRYVSTTETKAETKAILAIPLTDEPYQLADAIFKTQLIEDELNLNLAINGLTGNFSSQPGQTLNFTAYLKNGGQIDLRDVTLKLNIDGPSANEKSILDWPNIKDEYDGDIKGARLDTNTRRGEISWDGKKNVKLTKVKAGGEVAINVSLPIRNINQFDLTALETYQVKVNANADYKDNNDTLRSLASNQIIITLNSDLGLEIRDTTSQNASGQSEHKIKWVLTNNFHALKNIIVDADVYGDASWQADSPAPAGQITFNTSTKKITWTIPDMPENIDVLAMPFTIIINKLNPTQSKLMSKVKVEAEDTITKEKIILTGDEIKLQ